MAIRSLIAAADIYAILERTTQHRSAIDQELHRNAGAAVEMVIYNRQAGSPEFFDKERSVAVEYPTAKEGVPAGGRWQAYPEYDAWREVLVQEAAKVQEIKWRPTRKPTALVSMDVSHATLPAARQIESARRRLSYANSGLELEPSRTHDFLVARWAGARGDDRVFQNREVQHVAGTVTFVIDLSVSMIHERALTGNGARWPEAVSFARASAGVLQRAGFRASVYGRTIAGQVKLRCTKCVASTIAIPEPRSSRSIHSASVGSDMGR
ncbi:MAG: hypothetical protein IPL06_19830 [Betaproteobacteria bacterium]|nr:hypothetical protein [Betaproteobacteria bacterium]